MSRRLRSVVAVAFACGCLALGSEARAQTIETVVLDDGSTYEGELVEKIPGDHVTIKLATGEIKTFPWSQVTSAEAAPSSPPPPPPPQPTTTTDADADATSPHVLSGWPDPHEARSTSSDAAPDVRGPSFDFGLHTSLPQFGSPIGILGVAAEIEPVRWLGLEVAGAYDGPIEVSEGDLGWALAQTLRLGDSFGVGVGVSEHYGARGSGTLYMGHAELFFDLDLAGMSSAPLVVRMSPGVMTALNGASHPGACGFPFNMFASGGFDANGHPTDTKCMMIYFDIEVLFRVPLAGDARRSG